jgi:hypothetical protein
MMMFTKVGRRYMYWQKVQTSTRTSANLRGFGGRE